MQRNRVMDKPPSFVGIDVAKHRFDVHVRPAGQSWAVVQDEEGVATPVEQLLALGPELVVLEATGGMEVRVAAALAAAGLPVWSRCSIRVRCAAFPPARPADWPRTIAWMPILGLHARQRPSPLI